MKTVLVTGAKGQLGRSIGCLSERQMPFIFLFTDVETLDICDKAAVTTFLKERKIDYIVNCAAYTAVDKAEEDVLLCEAINRDAVAYLAEAAATTGAKIIHISTDYVFDGTNHRPYTEEDPTCPVSVYGRTKLAGEQALLQRCTDSVIIRTSWLYSEYGNNFVKTMLRLGAERKELRVIFDQIGTPTYAGDLASAILSLLIQAEQGRYVPGIYHFSNEGVCSWYDFAVRIMQKAALSAHVFPIESADFPAKATRPHYSVLNKAKIKHTYGLQIPHWEASLSICMNHLQSEENEEKR